MKILRFTILSLFTSLLILQYNIVYTQTVCSLAELVRELMEDLADNGRLDCLRESMNPNEAEETIEQRDLRLKANWDSDCSFEAAENDTDDWRKKFLGTYQLKYFVDAYGNPSEPTHSDFVDQADMCEIVRAMVANNSFSFGSNMENIPYDLISKIDCPGNDSQTQPCAINAGSFSDAEGWVILLGGEAITINDHMKYKLELDDHYQGNHSR